MTLSYNYLSKEDKKIIDEITDSIEKYSNAEFLGHRELLKKNLGDSNYISKDNIYEDYLRVKEDIVDSCPDELFFALMEKLTGSRFKGFIDKYKKDPISRLNYQPSKEWFDMEQLLDMDLEASGDVSIDNIASFMCIDKEFDEKAIRLSKPRFKAIGKVYKKTYAIDKAREDRTKIQINKDNTFRDRYDVYLCNFISAKLTSKAIDEGVHINHIRGFVTEHTDEIRDHFSYKKPVGEEKLIKRILPKITKDIKKMYAAFAKESARAVARLEPTLRNYEMHNALADYMEEQTQIHNKGNSIIEEIDKTFIQKAVHFKTLEEEHLRYHSQK